MNTDTSARSDFGPPKVTFRQMHQEAQRELSMRLRLYPQWVAAGKMTKPVADRQLDAMAAIAAHLAPMADAEKAEAEADKEAAEPRLL